MTEKTRNILFAALIAGVSLSAGFIGGRTLFQGRVRTVTMKMMPDSTIYTGTLKKKMKEGHGILVYKDSTVYEGQFSLDKRNGFGRIAYSDGSRYEGYFKDDQYSGQGTLTKDGYEYSGEWVMDNLPEGTVRTDGFTYEGPLSDLLPQGFGVTSYPGGDSYIGNWSEGYRHGPGKLQHKDGTFSFGIWNKGRLSESRNKNFSDGDFVYGIDISHHQPEIDWDNIMLYADNTGTAFYRKASTKQYPVPVSFVFMKATEKDNYVDPEYQKNADLADKHRITKGAYHFYRYGPTPEEQMRNFIQNSRYDDGDLPPVLDVEISISEVRRSGIENVQRDIKDCLEIIERERGVKPIIYTGKNSYEAYVNCPLLSGYDIWIARYGVADPGVHNRFWQFTCYGELGGMDRGEDIDIDIFNGDSKAFRKYLDKVTVKRF